MEKFLVECKKNLDRLDGFTKVHVVLGNESCDLDSAVSSTVTAYLLHELQPVKNVLVVPVLNIARKDVKLRTEVTYFFEQVDIPLDSIICRDEIDLKKLQSQKKLSLTLVDHNLLPKEDAELQGSVQEIIDHHRLETSHRCDKTVEMVGSCCTLVAEKVLATKSDLMNPQVALLLYGTILLDTVCMSEAARRTTTKDRDVVARLQALLPELTKDEVFKSLSKARTDVSGLTLDELLRKDLKTVCTVTKRVALSSVPGEIKDIFHENSMETELGNFCKRHGYDALIILTFAVEEKSNSIQRQLAVFSSDVVLKQQLTSSLMAVGEPSLDLQVSHLSTENLITFVQGNIQASRKVVLPVVRKFLSSIEEDNVLPKMNEHSAANGSPTTDGQQCALTSASSPDDTALRDPPFSPSDSSNSVSETAKDGGTEKFNGDSFDAGSTAELHTQTPSMYRAQTVDFPDSPLQTTKYGRHGLSSIGADEETDDDMLSRGDQFSVSEAIRAKDCESGSLNLSSVLEEYFEDSLLSGNLAVRGSVTPHHLLKLGSSSGSSSPSQLNCSEAETVELSSKASNFSYLSPDGVKPRLKHSTPNQNEHSLILVEGHDGLCTSLIEERAEHGCPFMGEQGDHEDGFLFEEKASGEAPDMELLTKIRRCFDESKIKDIYRLSGRLQDILTPQEVDEIIDNYTSYTGLIDDGVLEALSEIKSSGSWSLNVKSESPGQEKKVIVPDLQPLTDENGEIVVVAYHADDTPWNRASEMKAKGGSMHGVKVASVAPDISDEANLEVPQSLKKIDPEEFLLEKVNNLTFTSDNSSVSAYTEGDESAILPLAATSQMHSLPVPEEPLNFVLEEVDEVSLKLDHEESEVIQPDELQTKTPLSSDAAVLPEEDKLDNSERRPERPSSLSGSGHRHRRKIKVNPDILRTQIGFDDDQKSLSSLSNKSDGDVFSPVDDLATPDIETPDEMDDSVLGRDESTLSEPIPELSAQEEYTEERSWKTCNVGGMERKIDMKVIEPYKKVLSHGGYFGEARHAIIVFSACYLPDRGRKDYDYVMDNLFLYVLSTLDQLVAEDYVLIYLHGATERSTMPSFGWLKRCYQMIDRRLRKNLKGLYLVHPTFWLKTIVIMTRPFISTKFSRKLQFVNSIDELSGLVPLEHVSIPDKVKQYDAERTLEG